MALYGKDAIMSNVSAALPLPNRAGDVLAGADSETLAMALAAKNAHESQFQHRASRRSANRDRIDAVRREADVIREEGSNGKMSAIVGLVTSGSAAMQCAV